MSEPNIEVVLTEQNEVHCLKLIFRVAPRPGAVGTRVPMEIYLHTTQAIDLMHKLGIGISEYFRKASAELLEIKSRSLR